MPVHCITYQLFDSELEQHSQKNTSTISEIFQNVEFDLSHNFLTQTADLWCNTEGCQKRLLTGEVRIF